MLSLALKYSNFDAIFFNEQMTLNILVLLEAFHKFNSVDI